MNREQVVEFIKEAHFGYLATIGTDNAPRVRPLGIDTFYGDDLYFFTFNTTRKVSEMEANPHVEVVWAKLKELSQVRVRGKTMVVKDEAVIQRFKEDNPMVAKILPSGAEHLFCLFKIGPEKVEVAKGLVPYEEVVW